MKHSATAAFWKHYEALPAAVQKLADKNFDLLKLDPSHPSLNFKLIRGDLWSARIGLHYRALALKQEHGLGWFWIGSHSEYGRLLKLEPVSRSVFQRQFHLQGSSARAKILL